MLVFVKKYKYYKNSTGIKEDTSILLQQKNNLLYINIIQQKYLHQKTFIIFETNYTYFSVILTFITYEIYILYCNNMLYITHCSYKFGMATQYHKL